RRCHRVLDPRAVRVLKHDTPSSFMKPSYGSALIAPMPSKCARQVTANTILLVEDEAEIRDMLTFSLGRAGFHVWECGSAEEALQRLDGVLPSLLIVDWMLPGLSG